MFVVDPKIDEEMRPTGYPFGIITHPKTASQTIRKALREQLKARCPEGHHGYDMTEIDRILRSGGIVATVVRNPFDVMVSWWAYNQMKPYNGQYPVREPFEDWLRRTLEAGNGWIEKGLFYAAEHCNRIIQFEHDIEFQLNQCLKDCGLPPVKLDHISPSPRDRDYRKYYTPETAILVDRYCRAEIDEWGYTF